MTKRIISLSGKLKSGKDAVAKILNQVADQEVHRVAFADALKDELAEMFSVSVDEINRYKDFFRPFLQFWGTEIRRAQNPNYWVEQARARIAAVYSGIVVVTDTRFSNEALMLSQLGARMVNIVRLEQPAEARVHSELPPVPYREAAYAKFRSVLTSDQLIQFMVFLQNSVLSGRSAHSSETLMDNYKFDLVIENFWSLGDLEATVKKCLL